MRPFGGRLAVGAVCAVVGTLVAGCGEPAGSSSSASGSLPGTTGSDAGAPPSGEPVRQSVVNWANDYCGAVTELVRTFSDMPTIDPSTARSASRTSSEMLRAVVGGLERTLDRLDSLDPAPSEDAEQLRRRAVATYTDIRDAAAGARSELVAADDARTSREALSQANKPLDEIGNLNLLEGFDSVPELSTVGARAPACRDLTGSESAAPRIDSSADDGR